uniref:Peroxin/Ferlin domain-containing protein n=1 Tax=Plectus sambesii TaxID=2011161 RepID=A0A914WUD5_9BILA
MSSGYLWAVDISGTANRLIASPCPAKDDFLEWIPAHLEGNVPVRKLAVAPDFVWGIGANGRAYIYVTYSHIAVRVVEETFENERWYMLLGWSSRTLPTDRSNYSDRQGDNSTPKNSFHLPSDGWVWQDPWTVDLNEIEYDKTGWQYAFNFSSKDFKNTHFSGAFVRRRRWTRTRKYVGIERWIAVPDGRQSDESYHFIDISAGGFEQASHCSQRFACSLFALTRAGQLLFRDGIGPQSPEGTDWTLVDPVQDKESGEYEDLTYISCSASSGQLLALTWDGRLFARLGIAGSNRVGTGWADLARPKGLPVISAALGERTVWLITTDGKLWITSLISPMTEMVRCVTSASWTEMSQGMCRVTVGLDDQVLAICQSTERLNIRMDLNEKEPTGRCWKEIIASKGCSGETDEEAGNENDRWLQVDAGGCSINSKTIPRHWTEPQHQSSSFLSDYSAFDRKSTWRRKVIDALTTRNELIWNTFWDFSRHFGEDSAWTRHAKAQVLAATSSDWIDANLELTIEGATKGLLRVEIAGRGQTIELPFADIVCAFTKCDVHSKNVLEVHSPILPQSNMLAVLKKPLKIAFNTEDERDSWTSVIQATLCKAIPVFDRVLWAIDDQGLIYVCPISTHNTQSLSQQYWLQLRGHFKEVSAGCGVVWALGEDGKAWCLSPDYGCAIDPMFGEELALVQTDAIDEVLCENQRSSVLSGYCTFNGTANGKYYAWSDDSGTVKKANKDTTRLPSKHWQWANDWKIVNHDLNCDNEGWLYAKKFGTDFNRKKGSVRRRQWTRRRVFTAAAPWLAIDAPKLTRLSVQNDSTDSSHLLVWAVTVTGDLLCRQGVTSATPAGSAWKQVICDKRIVDICAGPNYHIWAVTSAGEALLRYCANFADITKCAWKCIPSSFKLKQIAVGANVVWGLDSKGDLYERTAVSSATPEGESWIYAYSDVQTVTTDSSGNLYALLKYSDPGVGTVSGVLARRTTENNWDYGIAGPWTCISLSSII